MDHSRSKINWKTAAGLVISNMIGTGVFTSLGFQLVEVQNTWSILLLWFLGGMLALIGALVYAELGTYFHKSGGDYIFLSETIHPAVGYLYAWVSLTVGFAAPIAIAAMAMNEYLVPVMGKTHLPGLFCLVAVPLAHMISLNRSGTVHNFLTLIKLVFIVVLIALGFAFAPSIADPAFDFSPGWTSEVLKPGFAVSLIYVFYAYTGWNAAAYIVEEVDHPRKTLPKALVAATGLVMILYLLLQLVFLRHAGSGQLTGKVEVASIAFGNLLGSSGAIWVSFFIAVQLIATISGYTWVGPRVTYAMARDYSFWRPVSHTNKNGIPVRAIALNTLISLVLFLSGSFEQVMLYAGFVLQLMGTVTVYSSLRVKTTGGFKTPFKPLLQYAYLIFSSAIMVYLFWDKPVESLAGLILIIVGLLLYRADSRIGTSG